MGFLSIYNQHMAWKNGQGEDDREQFIYRKQFDIEHIHVDRFGRATPTALTYFAQEVAGEHSQLLQTDDYFLQDKNLFWAISRTRLEISRLPHLGETITVETWPMPTTRVAYPRAVFGYDSHGSRLFSAVSLWVLMDQTTRNMVLPGKSGVTVEGVLMDCEPEVPHAIGVLPMEQEVRRTVGYSLLDKNGHMNNTRYMDWLDDLLGSEFHREHTVKEFTVCYMNEALEGDEIALHYALSEEQVLTVDARRGDTRIFSAQIVYECVL